MSINQYGYYFFLRDAVDAQLYAQTEASEQAVRLLLRRAGYTWRMAHRGEKEFFPLTGVSYVVVRVASIPLCEDNIAADDDDDDDGDNDDDAEAGADGNDNRGAGEAGQEGDKTSVDRRFTRIRLQNILQLNRMLQSFAGSKK